MSHTRPDILNLIREAQQRRSKKLDLSVKYNFYGRPMPLFSVPEEIFEMDWLEGLDLSGSYFREIPEAIRDLPNLIRLNLQGCPKLEKIPNIRGLELEYEQWEIFGQTLSAEHISGLRFRGKAYRDHCNEKTLA